MKENTSKHAKQYIEDQRLYTKRRGSYGPLGSISANGCGAVTIYNILHHFSMADGFRPIVEAANRNWLWTMPFFGLLGTNLIYMFAVLHKHGFRMRLRLFEKGVKKRSPDAYVLFYFWHKGFQIGAHYQAGFPEKDGGLILHNPHEGASSMRELLVHKKKREGILALLVFELYH